MRILLLDNYDSFTYNLHHLIQPLAGQVVVVLNDKFKVDDTLQYDAVVFSPGPGLPANAGVMMEIIDRFHSEIPMLGICLGMQAMAEYFGGKLGNLNQVLHGIPQNCRVTETEDVLYKNLPTAFKAGHYHSWYVSDVPGCFSVTAVHEDGWPLSFTHKKFPLSAVQYHPESVMTEQGSLILQNWVNAVRKKSSALSSFKEAI